MTKLNSKQEKQQEKGEKKKKFFRQRRKQTTKSKGVKNRSRDGDYMQLQWKEATNSLKALK